MSTVNDEIIIDPCLFGSDESTNIMSALARAYHLLFIRHIAVFKNIFNVEASTQYFGSKAKAIFVKQYNILNLQYDAFEFLQEREEADTR